MPRSTIPEDRINLRLIMVSGKTKDYLFKPSDSAGDIAQYIFDNWPEGKDLTFCIYLSKCDKTLTIEKLEMGV